MVQIPDEEQSPLVVAALGESGGGKSAFLNYLLDGTAGCRDEQFEEGEGAEACTREPSSRRGHWRGHKSRPVLLVDTPGLGGEGGPQDDFDSVLDTVDRLKEVGYVSAFVVVVRSSQFRFLSQHQDMFVLLESVFGRTFWHNLVVNVSHYVDEKGRRLAESWMRKLCDKFPAAREAKVQIVYIDVAFEEGDALEHLWSVCSHMPVFPSKDFQAVRESDIAVDKRGAKGSLSSDTCGAITPPPPPPPKLTPPPSLLLSDRPPRVPRVTVNPPRPGKLSGLPRSYMPPLSPTLSMCSVSMSPRLNRLARSRAHREKSPGYLAVSSSREASPGPTVQRAVNVPTYLRTSYAHKFAFKKLMKENKQDDLLYAEEERILFETLDGELAPLPDGVNDQLALPPHRPFLFVSVAHELVEMVEGTAEDAAGELRLEEERPAERTARLLVEEPVELTMYQPDNLTAKTPFQLVKKAVLPKIKYHWDKGFRQGPTGWQKVPMLKLKLKYSSEDAELLPASLSIEGGRWCETRRVRLDSGRLKVKLKAEGEEAQIRVVPLDKDGEQEFWVPEFLFHVDRLEEGGEEEKEDKWVRAKPVPAMPE